MDAADQRFAGSMNAAAVQFRTKYSATPLTSYETRQTASGTPYTVLKEGSVDPLRYSEWQASTQGAQQQLKLDQQQAQATLTRNQGQTRVQLQQRDLASYLAGHPMRPTDQLDYQISEWQEFLKRPSLDPQSKLSANQELDRLTNQRTTAGQEFNAQAANQLVTDTGAQNALGGTVRQDQYLDLSVSGDGTLASNRAVERQVAKQTAMDSAESRYAASMNAAAVQFRDKYNLDPVSSYETRRTRLGTEYQVLKGSSVDPLRFKEWQLTTQAAENQFGLDTKQADIAERRSAGQTAVTLAERGLTRQFSGQQLSQYEKLTRSLDFWKQMLEENLDQYARESVNDKVTEVAKPAARHAAQPGQGPGGLAARLHADDQRGPERAVLGHRRQVPAVRHSEAGRSAAD